MFCRYMGKVCRGLLRLLRIVMTFDGTVVRRGHASFMCTYFYILTEKVVFSHLPLAQLPGELARSDFFGLFSYNYIISFRSYKQLHIYVFIMFAEDR